MKRTVNLAAIFDFDDLIQTMSSAGDPEWDRRLKILRLLIRHERLPKQPNGQRYTSDQLIEMPIEVLTTAAREVLGAPGELQCLSATPVGLAKVFNEENKMAEHPFAAGAIPRVKTKK